ncbi:metallophosphoesterase [Zobellia alginiliquefaciens]|uniref:metallophosphoesterase n=1 Tax=Zobellia alginiliquefaciens TaxID=3032586 RepID=UPI0023E3932C|nr:metallophosphoesterase [Zobellia alginiliquefaciens]
MYNKLYLLLFFTVITTSVAQKKQESFLVKPYLQYSTKTSIRILWETNTPSTSEVWYGKAIKNAEKPLLNSKMALKGERLMHEVELKNLEEETNYFWKVISHDKVGNILESETYTFKSVVGDTTAFMFALVGDPQLNKRTPWAWDSIATAVWKERPNFVVNAGDLVDWGFNKEEWVYQFLGPGHDLMSRIPMYSVLGNHEGDADYYYQYMANPAPEYWYTFKYGNAEFFMIDSNRDISEGSNQYNWLEQKLATSTAVWKIAVHHHPPYSSESNDHGDTFNGAISGMGNNHVRDLPKLYDTYGVDFSLFGHTHVYERTWPLRDNRINQRQGTVYINSGGAGGGLESFTPTRNWFSLEVYEGHHYCTFAIYDKTLLFKAIDHQGRVVDSFQLDKDRDKDKVSIKQPPAPIIKSQKYTFHDETVFEMEAALDGLNLRYTMDGSEPSLRSLRYTEPVLLKDSKEIKARAFSPDGKASRTVFKKFVKTSELKATKIKTAKRGLQYKLYKGNWEGKRDTYLRKENISTEGILSVIGLDDFHVDEEYWAIEIEGYLDVPRTGTYTFYGLGSRGLVIKIDGNPIIEREHEQQEVVQLVLEKGYHKLDIQSFQRNWRKALGFGYWDEINGRTPFSPFELAHK